MQLCHIFLRTILATALLLSVMAGSGQATGDEKSIDLETSWRTIVATNDRLGATREEVEEARHLQDAAADLYWPEIGLSASYLRLDDDVTLSPTQILDSMAGGEQLAPVLSSMAASYGMTASQLDHALTSTIAERDQLTSSVRAFWPLYTGGRIDAAQEAAQGKVKEAGHRYHESARVQFETLVRYYFSTVLARKILDTRIDVENGLRQHRDHAVLLEQQGQIARVERMQSEASLDKAMVERRKAARDLEIDRVALSHMLKSRRPVQPSDGLFLNETLPPMDDFINQALEGHPGIALLSAKRTQAEALVKAEKGRYHPTLGLFGNYSLYEEESLATELMPDWMVGVSMNIPLIERSGRSGKLKAAHSTTRRIDMLTAQAKSDISVLVERSYQQAEQAREEYLGLGSSLELAKETVSLRTKAFSQGISTSLDVVDAEMFLASVKTQRAASVFNYIVALASLCGATGEPDRFFQFQQSQTTGVQ